MTPSELEKYSPMTIFALYKKNTFEGDSLVLALDANGGTIDGQEVENVKYLLDINLLDDQDIVQINGVTVKVKLALPEELKDYDSYEVVYVKDGKITERLACTVEDGYVVFNTSHLSEYGIVAKKNQSVTPGDNTGGGATDDPNKGNQGGKTGGYQKISE